MPTVPTKPRALSPSLERLLLVPLFGLPVLWLVGYFFPPINHDVAALLDYSGRWVAGERLYVDLIDENLPLTFVLHAIPVLTAHLLPGDATFWFTAWVVLGVAISFVACRRLVRLVPSADHALTEALLPPVLLFLFTVLPNEHFGQREHLMFVAAAPYLIASMARAESVSMAHRSAIAIGIAAGLGFALKPYYLAIPAAVEIYLLGRRGWRTTLRDPLPWAIGVVAVLHLVSMYTIFSDFGRFVLPLAIESYAPIGDAGWRQVLVSDVLAPTLLALLWLQLADAMSQSVEYRRCAGCPNYITIHPDAHRKHKTTCSDACRQRVWRAEKPRHKQSWQMREKQRKPPPLKLPLNLRPVKRLLMMHLLLPQLKRQKWLQSRLLPSMPSMPSLPYFVNNL